MDKPDLDIMQAYNGALHYDEYYQCLKNQRKEQGLEWTEEDDGLASTMWDEINSKHAPG